MKYCAKCGTQMSDDTMTCPQCYPTTNTQQPQNSNLLTPTKNTSSKIHPLIVTSFVLSVLALIIAIGTHFVSPSNNNLGNNGGNWNSTCPAD